MAKESIGKEDVMGVFTVDKQPFEAAIRCVLVLRLSRSVRSSIKVYFNLAINQS